MLTSDKSPFVAFVENETFLPLSFRESTRILVMKIAVKSEVPIPIRSVVAKPLMGPVPKIKRINAVNPVVILASKIEDSALLNPSAIAFRIPFPFLNSSRTRSKIRTFASTEIPMVNTIPAIPGKVSTAPRPARIPKIKRMFNNNAMSANNPELP